MYQRNVDSEKIRDENEMRRLRQKLTDERFKSITVKQFKNLIKDNRNMMEYIYPIKISANNAATLLHAEQQENVSSHDVRNHSGRRIEGSSQKNLSVNDHNESNIHLNARSEKNLDNTEENDFQTKLKHAETKNDKKIVEEEKHNDIDKDE